AHLGPPALSEEMKQKVMVELALQVAHTNLPFDEWNNIKNGDFVILDHCSYDPTEHKGSVVLTLDQKPLFRGRLKDGGIKITSYRVYGEVSDVMEERFGPNEEDEDLYGDIEEEEESELEEDEDLFAGLEPRKPREEAPRAEGEQRTPLAEEKEMGTPPKITP